MTAHSPSDTAAADPRITGNPADGETPVRVLFVCTGNICRSPTAEAVFRAQAEAHGLAGRLSADSAGLTDYHQGEPADQRSIAAAARRGYDVSGQRARQVHDRDFADFDYIVALDSGHKRSLDNQRARLGPGGGQARIVKLMDYVPDSGRADVPDPYYGGPQGFELVLDLVEAGCAGLIGRILPDSGPDRR